MIFSFELSFSRLASLQKYSTPLDSCYQAFWTIPDSPDSCLSPIILFAIIFSLSKIYAQSPVAHALGQFFWVPKLPRNPGSLAQIVAKYNCNIRPLWWGILGFRGALMLSHVLLFRGALMLSQQMLFSGTLMFSHTLLFRAKFF